MGGGGGHHWGGHGHHGGRGWGRPAHYWGGWRGPAYYYEEPVYYVNVETCPDPREVRALLIATRGRMVPELARKLCLQRYCAARRLLPGTALPSDALAVCGGYGY